MDLGRRIRFVLWLLVFTSSAGLSGCGGTAAAPAGAALDPPQPAATTKVTPTAATVTRAAAPQPQDPVVVLHTTAGDLKLLLFAEKSPQTVDNFLRNYASRGFYDQTIFHHLEPGSMLIGGGYTADLVAKPTRAAVYNESRNALSNRRGTVAMIRDPEVPHSANSQFFVNLADNPHLDFQTAEGDEVLGYCVFGEVVEGLDVVERIAQLPTSASGDFAGIPSPMVVIQSVERVR